MAFARVVDPWNDSIDGVVLTLKQELAELSPPYSKAGPIRFWAQDRFAEIAHQEVNFSYREVDRRDVLFTEKWSRIYQKVISGPSIERIAAFSVYFQPRTENKYIEHLGVFIKSKIFDTGYPTIPVLSVQREINKKDVEELCTRYVLPVSKHFYDFERWCLKR